ncbi:Dolichyl-diphosphooligosaccharide-protein glycosyltransferase subunit dad1, partial [Stylosanthes scabra]|nr:Dolichyl-diphosphooligosaccharide-protein glycosyltransferase subunit dad1 [Stylosanthes scabra]
MPPSPMLHHHHGSLAAKSTKPMCITLIQPTTTTKKHSYSSSHDHDTLRKMERMMNLPSPLPPSSSTTSEKVGKRWKEYQGMSNWDGLLDPLDDNLRAEILRYGHFVEAAYKSFDFDPSSPNYANCRFPKTTLFDRCQLPNTGYKVTKHLRATSGIQLPNWVDKAPASSWIGTQSSYVGYVAVCDNKEEIKRLGRRDVVIALRGTTTCLEWLENLRANLTLLPCNMINGKHQENNGIGPMVESGFLSLYTSTANSSSLMSLQEMVREEITRILRIYEGEPLSLTVTGHSLGAALATLTAFDTRAAFPELSSVTVISFGGPRVGNRSFRTSLEKQGTKVLRIVNCEDVITKVPGFVFDEVEKSGGEVGNNGGFHVAGLPSWIQKRAEEAQWVYSEVGEELRLSSRDSPYLRGVNVATCHDLNTYLHLVDGFVSSTCPFRSTARRFLQRR